MIVGDLMLMMNGAPYFGTPIAKSTNRARFAVQVTNFVGGALILSVAIEHRNRDDVVWTTAGTFTNITADGTYALDQATLKELLRYRFTFSAGGATDGAYVFAATPQWLRD